MNGTQMSSGSPHIYMDEAPSPKSDWAKSYLLPALALTAMVTAPAPAVAKSNPKVRTPAKVRTFSVEEFAAMVTPVEETKVVASVKSRQLSFIHEITGLDDKQLGEVFPGTVSRESVCNWRGDKHDMRPANVYALGVIFDLARSLANSPLEAKTWLHQRNERLGEVPFDLLRQGKIADVQNEVNVATHQARDFSGVPNWANEDADEVTQDYESSLVPLEEPEDS